MVRFGRGIAESLHITAAKGLLCCIFFILRRVTKPDAVDFVFVDSLLCTKPLELLPFDHCRINLYKLTLVSQCGNPK